MANLWDLINYAQRPGNALTGLIRGTYKSGDNGFQAALDNLKGTRQDTGSDIASDVGIKDPLTKAALGLVWDIGTDPLAGVGKVAKAAGVYNKARTGVTGALRESELGKSVLQKFSNYEHLNQDYAPIKRLFDSEIAHQGHTIEQSLHDINKGATSIGEVTPELRQAIARGMEQGTENLPEQGKFIASKIKEAYQGRIAPETAAGVFHAKPIENYTPYAFRKPDMLPRSGITPRAAINAVNPHTLPRQIKSYDEFLSHSGADPITDVYEAFVNRMHKGMRSEATGNFLQKVASNPQLAQLTESAPQGWKGISAGKYKDMEGLIQSLSGKVFEPSVADDINKLLAIEPVDETSKMWQKMMQGWKSGATYLRPGFHVKNYLGNMWNMGIGGASPNAMWEASKGALKPNNLLNTLTPEQQLMARKHGIVGGAVHAMKDIGRKEGPQAIEEMLGNKKGLGYAQAARKLGGNVEDASKLSFFKDYIARNPNKLEGEALLNDALFNVKRYLFDYQELTKTEKSIRNNAAPFWTFYKKNLPIQIEGLINKPNMTSGLGHVKHAIEGAIPSDQRVLPEAQPDYVRDQGGIQVPGGGKDSLFLNLPFPITDLNSVNVTDPEKMLQDWGGRLAPHLKAIAELALNKSFFTGRDIHNPNVTLMEAMKHQKVKSPLPQLTDMFMSDKAKGKMPLGLNYALQQFPAIAGGIKGFGNIGPLLEDQTVPAQLINFFAGLGMTSQTDEQLYKNVERARAQEKRSKTTLDRMMQ